MSESVEARAVRATNAAHNSKRRGRQSFLNGEIHSWYSLVLGYSDHVVSFLIDRLGVRTGQHVLDPFCGAGTTLVECLKRRLSCTGIDANPASCFASRVKTDWSITGRTLTNHLDALQKLSRKHYRRKSSLRADQTYRYMEESGMIERGWIRVLHLERAIAIKLAIGELATTKRYRMAFMLALLGEVVQGASNMKFGPEIYCGPAKPDRNVFEAFAARGIAMGADLKLAPKISVGATVVQGDARDMSAALTGIRPSRFHAVISSPPYPAEHDYTRNGRLELAFLEHVIDVTSFRAIKRDMIRCHSKGIYSNDSDALEVSSDRNIQSLARRIQKRAAGKTHKFATLYPAVIRHYFGGMKRHLISIRPHLVPGAKCAYVLGDQAGYLRVHIRTADILAKIAEQVGYKVVEILRWREASVASSKPTHEKILIIQKPEDSR